MGEVIKSLLFRAEVYENSHDVSKGEAHREGGSALDFRKGFFITEPDV